MSVRLITRAEWGARSPKQAIDFTTWDRRIGVAFHYSDTDTGGVNLVKSIQNHSMDERGMRDMMYNALVDVHGNAYEGRAGGWLAIAAHAENQNTPWIGICFLGRNEDLSVAALATMRGLYDDLNVIAPNRLNYTGHRGLPGQSTDCPGDNIMDWLRAGMPIGGNTVGIRDDADAWVQAWRVAALAGGVSLVENGPLAGEPMWLVAEMKKQTNLLERQQEILQRLVVGTVDPQALAAVLKPMVEQVVRDVFRDAGTP